MQMGVGDLRMVEVSVCDALHADALHHRDGRPVDRDCEGEDLLKGEGLERQVEPCTRGLGGDAAAPELRRQPPADLGGAARKMRFEINVLDAAEAGAFARLRNLDGGEAVAVRGNLVPQLVHQRVGRGAVVPDIEEFHHPIVGIDAVKEVPVAVAPVAEDEARRPDRGHWRNSSRR